MAVKLQLWRDALLLVLVLLLLLENPCKIEDEDENDDEDEPVPQAHRPLIIDHVYSLLSLRISNRAVPPLTRSNNTPFFRSAPRSALRNSRTRVTG